MVFDITNATICFFHLALLFLVSSFVVRRYDDIYLISAQYTPSNKILCFVKRSVGKKINQFLANTRVSEWYLNL